MKRHGRVWEFAATLWHKRVLPFVKRGKPDSFSGLFTGKMEEVNNKFSYTCSSTHWLVTGSIIDGSKLQTIDSFKFL